MKQLLCGVLMVCAFLAWTGCSSLESKQRKLQLGMTKQQATALLGSDFTVVGARVDPSGKPIEVISYAEKRKEPLLLYFRDNSLVQWGDSEVLKNMPAAPGDKPK